MHTLHLVGFDRDDLILTVRGVRAAIRMLDGGRASSVSAAERVGIAGREHYALLGQHEDRERVEAALAVLVETSQGSAVGLIDATPTDLAAVVASQCEEDSGDIEGDPFEGTPPAVWRTAMVLMASANGNPLVACAQARNLLGTTDNELYSNVILSLASAFAHFLPAALREQGFFESDE